MDQVLLLALVGLASSTALTFQMFKDKYPGMLLLLGFSGFMGGWLGGMIWVFITGGFDYAPYMVILPVCIASFFNWIILKYFDVTIRLPKKYKLASVRNVVSGIFVVFISVVVISMFLPVPIYAESVNRHMISPSSFEFNGDLLYPDVDTSDVEGFVKISIDAIAANFPDISEDADVNDYLMFEVLLEVSNDDWVEPYVKIVLAKDTNSNGRWDSASEEVWYSWHWKTVLGETGESSNWRSNTLYGPNPDNPAEIIPYYQMHVGGPIMPIIHGGISVWRNDNGVLFENTPERYTAPWDQYSWLYDADTETVTYMEDINSYSSIADGSSSKIFGKVYCDEEYAGDNVIVAMVFDARYQIDPWDDGASPISTETYSFNIDDGSGNGGGTPDFDIEAFLEEYWIVLVIGGGGLIFGNAWLKRRRSRPTEIVVQSAPIAPYYGPT